MKLQRIIAVTAVAAFTLSTLTGCPWDNEEPGSPSSSSSTTTRPSHDDDSSDSGDDDTFSSTPEEPEDMGFTYDEETGYTITSSEGLMNWAKQENVTTADCTLDADVEVSNWTKADVTGTSTIGGMVAVNQRGTIKGCVANGNVTSENSPTGGIAGSGADSSIIACAVTGDVTTSATSATVGGIMSTIANTSIDACYYSGEVQTGEYGRVNNYGTEVDSWTDEEIKDMNTYLTDCEYEFALNKEKQPVLVKKGSAEQAVNRLLGHFWG